jgi:hypothetical protein
MRGYGPERSLVAVSRGAGEAPASSPVNQPRAGIFGDAFFGPEFERSHQGILGQFFCDADIVGDSGNGCRFRAPPFDVLVKGAANDFTSPQR